MRACREFIAYPEALLPPELAAFRALPPPTVPQRNATSSIPRRTRHPVRAMRAFGPAPAPAPALLWQHPLIVGLLLLALPPLGVTALWASPRFDFAAKLAVTLFAAFASTLAAVVATIAIALG